MSEIRKVEVCGEEEQVASIRFAAGNDETTFEALSTALRAINTTIPDTNGKPDVSKQRPKKPEEVTLILMYGDGYFHKETLSGSDVPDAEDWEDLADRQWQRKLKHGPLLFIKMMDKKRRQYLKTIRYSFCPKRCTNRRCFSSLGCLPNDPS